MSMRKNSGATLGLVVTTTIVIVVIGIAIFWLMKILGGQRELQNAADAGTLNIAKQALVEPWVHIDTSSSAIDATLATVAATKSDGAAVDLFYYNRLVGQELLVAINAAADGGSTGITNAQNVIAKVQGYGTSLKSYLNDPINGGSDTGWVQRYFNVAQTNSVRMENNQPGGGAITYTPSAGTTWNTAYMDKGTESNMLLNLRNLSQDTGPFGQPYNGNGIYPPYATTATADGYATGSTFDYTTGITNGSNLTTNGFLQGYVPFTVNGVGDICAIPTEPSTLPHGVSLSNFAAAQNPTANGLPAWVPPNAFETVSHTLEVKSNTQATNTSAAVIGTQQQTRPSTDNDPFWAPNSTLPLGSYTANGFVMGMPNGYIIVDNSGVFSGGPSSQSPVTFPLPNTDNADAMELGGAGITVTQRNGSGAPTGFADGTTGTANQSAWQTWSANAQANGMPANPTQSQFDSWVSSNPNNPPPSSMQGMYNADGTAVNNPSNPSNQNQLQAFNNTVNTSSVLCTDNNTVTSNPNHACNQEDTPPSSSSPTNPNALAPFNLAYHPNSVNNPNSASSSSLEAVEELKCEIGTLYGPTPSGSGWNGQMPTTSYGATGLRLYPDSPNNPLMGQEAPWNPANQLFNAPGVYTNQNTGFGDGQTSNGDAVQIGNNGCSYCDANTPCKITHDGSIWQLFKQLTIANPNQPNDPNYLNARFSLPLNGQLYVAQVGGGITTTGPLDGSGISSTVVTATNAQAVSPQQQVYNFIAQRMHEIKPWVTKNEIDNVVGTDTVAGYTIPLGSKKVIYLDQTGAFQMTDYNNYFSSNGSGTHPGAYLQTFLNTNSGLLNADGTPHWFQREYAAFGYNGGNGSVNPQLEFGIHDQLFTSVSGDLAVYDTYAFTPSSGTYNNLGTIAFSQYVTDHYTLGSTGTPPTLTGRN